MTSGVWWQVREWPLPEETRATRVFRCERPPTDPPAAEQNQAGVWDITTLPQERETWR